MEMCRLVVNRQLQEKEIALLADEVGDSIWRRR
jgi:hypothetical protein